MPLTELLSVAYHLAMDVNTLTTYGYLGNKHQMTDDLCTIEKIARVQRNVDDKVKWSRPYCLA